MADPEVDRAAPGRGTPARIAIAIVVIGLAAMWGYVLYLAVGPGRQAPIDRLDDERFARAAESRCAQALDEIDALPDAVESPTPDQRADVVAEANAALGAMLDDLEAAAPVSGDDARYASEWLADWRIYLADRERYVEALRVDDEARFLVSEKQGERRHITGWIDEFAKANRMESCTTPDDV